MYTLNTDEVKELFYGLGKLGNMWYDNPQTRTSFQALMPKIAPFKMEDGVRDRLFYKNSLVTDSNGEHTVVLQNDDLANVLTEFRK